MAGEKYRNGRDCVHLLGEGSGVWAPALFPHTSRGSGAPLQSKMEGEGVEEQPPATPQAHRNTLTPKAPPPVGHHHIQGQTTTPRPHHSPPCLLTPPTATLWPLHQRDWAGGEEEEKEEEGWP